MLFHYYSLLFGIVALLAAGLAAYAWRRHLVAEHRLRQQNEQLKALNETTFGLVNRLELDSLLESLVVRAGALLDTPHGYLYIVDPAQNDLVVRVATGIFSDKVGYRLERGEGLAGRVWHTGQAISIDNYIEWPERRRDLDPLRLRALVSVPIHAGADFVGVLGLAYLEGDQTFGVTDISLLERFADLASLALENARLYSAAQQEIEVRRHTEAALRSVEADLRVAKDQAEMAIRAKSEFLAQMSHDMRIPVSSAIGIVELLEQTNLDAEQRELVEIIRTSGSTLLTLSNNFLDLVKIESGKLELKALPFNLQACIEDAIDLVAGEVISKELDLAYSFEPHTPITVIGDQPRLCQILVNLLGNATKFTDTGGIMISVDARPASEGRYQLHFSVADTGIGIPVGQLDKVFDSFYSTSAHQSPGTGLGLAIARQLSEQMGGRMWVESMVGIGSTFHFTVTLKAATAPFGSQPGVYDSLVGKHMLILNQAQQSREALSMYAHSIGMQVSLADTAREALMWAENGVRYDIIVADIRDANREGIGLITQLRECCAMPELPIILLAPLGLQDQRILINNHEIFLRKPLKLSQFRGALLGLFASQHQDHDDQVVILRSQADAGTATLPRILIVEDDHANQQLAVRILQKEKYPHAVVGTGAQALAVLEHEHYDIVLLDVQLPDLDGVEVARLIRKTYPNDQQPYLIAISAATSPDIVERCLSAGMNDFLAKPLRIAVLHEALAQYHAQDAISTSTTEQIQARTVGVFDSDSNVTGSAGGPLDVVALRRVRDLFGTDHDKRLGELVETYRNDSAALLTEMRAANVAHNRDLLAQAAHKLKSSSAIVAALTLADLCKQFEAAMHTSAIDDWEVWIQKIEAEFGRVQISLEKEFLC